MIIDCHVHHYPPELAVDASGWARAHGEVHWASTVAAHPRAHWPETTSMLRAMDAAGLDRVVLLGWYWQRLETCAWHWEWHRRCLDAAPDRFLACCPIAAGAGPAALELAKRAAGEGCCGYGEFLPPAQDHAWDHPVWEELAVWAAGRGLPFSIHVTEPVGHRYAGRVETPLTHVTDFIRRHPDLPIVLAHWGGGLPFYALNPRLAAGLNNVYYDTAAGSLLYKPRIWTAGPLLAGPGRILFGSDFPLPLYRRLSPEAGWRQFLQEAQDHLPVEEVPGALGQLAERIFLPGGKRRA